VKKWIGAYAAALGGIDTLVFSGGIGEHAAEVRSRICAGMGFLGIELDAARNSHNDAVISARLAAVKVRMMRTDEESMIARGVCAALGLALETETESHEPNRTI
jgi:acetate kinase